MKNGQQEEQDQELDFPNDSLTDWVLHKEDQPVIRNGEIINEPEDVAEKSLGDKDCWFPIHFNYSGIDHTADVLKREGEITEYHVTAVLPVIDHLPDPYIVASTFSKDAFDFPVNETFYPRELGLIIKQAIGNGCNHSDIALA